MNTTYCQATAIKRSERSALQSAAKLELKFTHRTINHRPPLSNDGHRLEEKLEGTRHFYCLLSDIW